MPKISDLTTRNVASSDLLAVVDPTTGVAGKATVLAVTAAGTDFLTQAEADALYAPTGDYLTEAEADALYEPIGGGSAPVELAGTAGNEFIRVEDETLLSSTVGDARGKGAIDLQIKRTTAANVASGTYSLLLAGKDCKANGNYGTALGKSSVASGAYALACGNACTASQSGAVAVGDSSTASGTNAVVFGASNTSSGTSSVATGLRAVASMYGQKAHAAGRFAANGDAQTSQFVLRASTTDATQTEMFLDGSSARMVLSNDSTWHFDIMVVARRTDANDESATYRFTGGIDRNASAATTALLAEPSKVSVEDTVAWDVDVTADTTNGSLRIRVTGQAAKTIQWVAFTRVVSTLG